MKERVKTIISYGFPAVIVLFLMSVILLVQGIWPFGSETVDFYDMAQQLAAEYLQIYDEMHGAKSFIYDWYTSLGRGIPGGTYIALTNLLYYFVPRDMILETFSIMLIIKTMCMAVTMRVYLKKEFSSCPDFYSVILSAGYGLCGFVMMQYTIIVWLDIAMMVPLIFMYAQRLLREGKMTGYIVCVSITFLVNFYLPAVTLLFIFIMTGIYIISLRFRKGQTDGEEAQVKRPYILRLGIATAVALLIQSWTWIPKLLSASGSMRFSNESEGGFASSYIKILTHVQPDYASRLWCLLGVSFAAAIAITGMFRDLKRKNISRLFFVAGAFAVLLLQLIFENIQLIWHFGSYVNYPTRNGYLMYIVFAVAAASYASEVVGDRDEKQLPTPLLMGGIVVAILLCSVLVFWYRINSGMSVYTVFRVSVLLTMGCFVIYLFAILYKSGKYVKMSVFLVCAELIFYGVILIGKPLYITGYSEEAEQEGEYIRIANELDEAMDIPSSRLDRIKNPDTSLNTNYGAVLQRATLTGWPAVLSEDVLVSAYNMGYSVQYTRILDSGGNAFTDALLHTTQVIAVPWQDENLYSKAVSAKAVVDHATGKEEMYSLYDCRFILPYGTVLENADALGSISDASNPVEFANAVYKGICSDETDIADRIETGELNRDFHVSVEGKKLLYITTGYGDAEYGNIRLYVEERAIPIPTLKHLDNMNYPAHFNNNSLYLGSYSDEDVSIRIEKDETVSDFDYDFILYSIDLDKLEKLCREYQANERGISVSAGKRNLDIKVNGSASEYIMLPMQYDNNWTAVVNGVNVKPVRVNGLLMAVPLAEGENTIHMSFFPKTMKYGIIVSVIVLFVTVLVMVLLYRAKKTGKGIFMKFSDALVSFEKKTSAVIILLYMCAWTVLMTGMYVITTAYGIFYYVKMFIG